MGKCFASSSPPPPSCCCCTGTTWRRLFSLMAVIESIKWLTVRSKERKRRARIKVEIISSTSTPTCVRCEMNDGDGMAYLCVCDNKMGILAIKPACCVNYWIFSGMDLSPVTIRRQWTATKISHMHRILVQFIGIKSRLDIFGIRHNPIKSAKLLHVNDISNWHCKFVPRNTRN